MAAELIISVSGLRGVVGESLTPDVAYRYATAFAQTLPSGPVLITRDGRANGGQFVVPVAAGLSQGGQRNVLDGGIAATPTTGVLVRTRQCAGGIQISASHNPAEYNGLKLFAAQGRVVPADAGQRVLENYRQQPNMGDRQQLEYPTFDIHQTGDTTTDHLALVERIVDVERIRSQQLRVLLDANHGSGSILGRRLLEYLGCSVTCLGEQADGLFDHRPEPTEENLAGVLRSVSESRSAVGFCQDPDADRLAIIDEAGRYIGEEYTLAICVDHVLRRVPGPVVTNCSTSRMSEDLARRYNVPFFRSAVGEANVVDLMLRENAVIGGEGNGGAIDPRVGLVRDSFVGMALVLDAMATRNSTISALARELPSYAMHKTKVDVARDRVANSFARLQAHFHDAKPDRLDGLRLDWPDSWLLVRASNTEPIVRIMAEAGSAPEARSLCDEAAAILRS